MISSSNILISTPNTNAMVMEIIMITALKIDTTKISGIMINE